MNAKIKNVPRPCLLLIIATLLVTAAIGQNRDGIIYAQQENLSSNIPLTDVMGISEYFNNPENLEVAGSAPFYYKTIEGDFVASVLVEPDFSDLWNAGALMVHIDSARWIKFAFENSDATGKSIVSVVTQGASDDANGVVLNGFEKIWLRVVRIDNNYSMHWSTDGSNYTMTRLTHIPFDGAVKVGMEAQCPAGGVATHRFHHFSIESKTVENLREGTLYSQ